jgi:small subunit ribosomal protein S16
MAVSLKLARFGKKSRPFYRIVVIDKTKSRDSRYIEAIGTYDPLSQPHKVELNEDRLKYWVGVGAQISNGLSKLNVIKK